MFASCTHCQGTGYLPLSDLSQEDQATLLELRTKARTARELAKLLKLTPAAAGMRIQRLLAKQYVEAAGQRGRSTLWRLSKRITTDPKLGQQNETTTQSPAPAP